MPLKGAGAASQSYSYEKLKEVETKNVQIGEGFRVIWSNSPYCKHHTTYVGIALYVRLMPLPDFSELCPHFFPALSSTHLYNS